MNPTSLFVKVKPLLNFGECKVIDYLGRKNKLKKRNKLQYHREEKREIVILYLVITYTLNC